MSALNMSEKELKRLEKMISELSPEELAAFIRGLELYEKELKAQ